ncbi:hypothetical protein A6770_38550 [Nostoc minutum NIES-26]|uniref:Uncharacterized protein n=1 Tax=Nostoc minutum NIES-26 TaxID=1844469 RepID=A0A367RSR6_9NOSO|nr:hypothetical protein A6770_38550 [Nostoc minutum NIES-26]
MALIPFLVPIRYLTDNPIFISASGMAIGHLLFWGKAINLNINYPAPLCDINLATLTLGAV